MRFIDASAQIGQGSAFPVKGPPDDYTTAGALVRELDHFGINEAVVAHAAAQHNPIVGNRLLMQAIADHPRLYPCWTLAPFTVDEQRRPAALVDMMRAHNVRMVRLAHSRTGAYKGPPRVWACGELLEALERARIPVLLNESLDTIAELCAAFPELPVIKVGWGSLQLHALMDRREHLYVGTGLLCGPNRLAFLVRRFGADRLVFGTLFGQVNHTSPGAALTVLTAAAISDEDKEKIAGGNLARLLGLPAASPVADKAFDDPFVEPVRAGRPLADTLVVDAHAHATSPQEVNPDVDRDGMVRGMDRLGVDVACISGSGSAVPDARFMNEATIQALRAYPSRFVGYTRIAPWDASQAEAQLEHCFRAAGIRHVKVHPNMYKYPVNGEGFRPGFAFARKHGSVVLSHSEAQTDTCRPAVFDETARTYPDLQIIIGHAGNWGEAYKETVDVMKRHPNLWLDTSGWCMTSLGVLEWVVGQIGPDRVLMGTDFVAISAAYGLGPILYARLSAEDKRKILGRNAARLFGLDGGAGSQNA